MKTSKEGSNGRVSRWVAPFVGAALVMATQGAHAAATIKAGEYQWVSIGVGARAQYTAAEDAAPSGSDYSNQFRIQETRLYVAGQVHEYVKLTFNSFCESCVFGANTFSAAGDDGQPNSGGDWEILDVIAQFEINPMFNVWVGRMLTPADRIEMNGPFYAMSWNQYNVALLPSDGLGGAGLLGRDDGVTGWGALDKFEYAIGVFDGLDGTANGANEEDNVMIAGRLEYNFLSKEPSPAYYTASTYFGEAGDIFTVGFSLTHQADFYGVPGNHGDFTGYIVDALFEKVLPGGGVVNVEGEYKIFDTDDFADVDSYFVTVGYMFPKVIGIGRFQPYVRWVENDWDVGPDTDLIEVGLNYRIKGYDAWINFNYQNGDAAVGGGPKAQGSSDAFQIGVQVQI